MNCILVSVTGGLQELYPITEGALTIGRESDNDIQILDEAASRHHARINNLSETCEIEDLNSSNGLFVNGSRIQRCSLNHGDTIKFGNTVLRIERVNYEVSTDTTTRDRDYSTRSQHSTIKVKQHPDAGISPKRLTTTLPPLRLKEKPPKQ